MTVRRKGRCSTSFAYGEGHLTIYRVHSSSKAANRNRTETSSSATVDAERTGGRSGIDPRDRTGWKSVVRGRGEDPRYATDTAVTIGWPA